MVTRESTNQVPLMKDFIKTENRRNFVRDISILSVITYIFVGIKIASLFGVFIISEELDGWIALASIMMIVVWMKCLYGLWKSEGKKIKWLPGLLFLLSGTGEYVIYAALKHKKGESVPKLLEDLTETKKQ